MFRRFMSLALLVTAMYVTAKYPSSIVRVVDSSAWFLAKSMTSGRGVAE